MSAKPHALLVDPESIPAELKALRQWVAWQYQWVADRLEWAKVPLQAVPLLGNTPTPRRAASTKPKTWASFDEALQAYELHPPMAGEVLPPDDANSTGNNGLDGIGLCLTADDPYCGIDLDKCLKDGNVTCEHARHILELMADTYIEVSPSGTGLRIFARGKKPGGRSKRGNIEMYDGAGGRYLTVTGRVWRQP